METIMQYIPLAVSAILLAALILTVITNIITQVVKKITWNKIPTNILAVVVAMAVTLVAFFAVFQIMGWAVTWYMVAGAVALGLFVAYAAMFGFDKLREALEQVPLGLDGPGRLALEELGEVLGRYDGDGQREALAHTRAELSRALEQAREAREKQGRMYQVLGITAGAFLVILLL